MKKIPLRFTAISLVLLFFLVLIFSTNFPFKQIFAATCSISATPAQLSLDFNGRVTITSTTDCFDTNVTYMTTIHPQSKDNNSGLYANYDRSDNKPQNARALIINVNLFQAAIGKSNPGSWVIRVCTPGKPIAECKPGSAIEVGSTFVNVLAEGATPAPAGPGFQPTYCDPPANTKLQTAIGCIPIAASGFVTFFLGYLLGIAGVIAFFLIILAAFQILTSGGNPEKLEGAKQLLTAAIVGLFFIIFSVVLLQVIGVDILGRLPGFPEFTKVYPPEY